MSNHKILSLQSDETSSHSQFEFMPLYGEKIGQIRDEFQSTINSIQSAMMLAISNYDKKCDDYETMLGQWNAEKNKTQSLEEQVEYLKNVIKQKDKLILKLQQCKNNCKHSGKFNLGAIDQLKKEIAESIKSNVIKKSTRNFATKLRSFSNSVRSERNIWAKDKNVPNCLEEEGNNSCSKKDILKPDAMSSKIENKIHKPQFCDHMKCKHETELNVEKACKNRVKMELGRIIQKNKAVIDEFKEVQKRYEE